MTNENSIKLVVFHDTNLPKRTIALSSKNYSIYKNKEFRITRNPVISANSILSDINIIESSTLNDETCSASTDIIIDTCCNYDGDIMNIIPII